MDELKKIKLLCVFIIVLAMLIIGCDINDQETIEGMMPTNPTVTFDGNEYPLRDASFSAWLTTPSFRAVYGEDEEKWINWSISVRTKQRADTNEYANLNLDGLMFQIRDWTELEGAQLTWSKAINLKTNFRYGMIYFYDHQLVPKGQVRFLKRNGVTFYLEIRAENEEGQVFTYTGPVDFSGLTVKATESDSESSIREYLEQLIDTSTLVGGKFELDWKYEDRIEMGEAVFTPNTK